ncbi:MAG: 4Fe-4S single cluster domain-containing protein [Eubacteriales bacterium]|nr:4Fe-4S single cluster domain-containing protein [Eubacteriales bacterium]
MRIHSYVNITSAEGPGKRFCVWMQGCRQHCVGCYNSETWPLRGGSTITLKKLLAIYEKAPENEGVTLLGGEPFLQPKPLEQFCQLVHKKGKSVVVFTGYTLEQLLQMGNPAVDAFLHQIDLLIDGPYIQALQDFSRPWVGSSNQRYHFLTERYCQADIAAYVNKLEIRLQSDGKVRVNGIADEATIESIIKVMENKVRI